MAHYLDHAATTPVAPGVIEAWVEVSQRLAAQPGNPSSLHGGGRAARQMLEDARERIAGALGADRAEVVFTSGATEADALAVAGCARGVTARNPARRRVLVSGAEHDAVLEQGDVIRAAGLDFEVLPLDRHGRTDLFALTGHTDDLEEAWADVALVSVVFAASEIGTLQPVRELVAAREAARKSVISGAFKGSDTHEGPAVWPVIHTDAAQALSTCSINFHDLNVDALTIGGHKVGGPVGNGALLIRRGTPFVTDRPGGGHERGIRSGTPDAAGATALATAIEYVCAQRAEASAHAKELRDYLARGLAQTVGAAVSESDEAAATVASDSVRMTVPPDLSVATIIHLSLPTRHPEALLLAMDAAGVHVSAGSACHAGVTRPSEVMLRMGRSEDEALGVLRLSTSFSTTTGDIDAFLAALPGALASAQALDQLERRA